MSGTFKAVAPLFIMVGAGLFLAGGGAKDIAGDIANPGRPDPFVQTTSYFLQTAATMCERLQFKADSLGYRLENWAAPDLLMKYNR